MLGNRWVHYGGLDKGSINLAELMPILQAIMLWHETGRGKEIISRNGVCRITAITDSSYVAMATADAIDPYKPLPDKHTGLFSAIRQYVKMGYLLQIHHQKRNTTLWNQYADVLASQARRSVIQGIADNMASVSTDYVASMPLEGLHP